MPRNMGEIVRDSFDRLEEENKALRAENARIRAENDAFRAGALTIEKMVAAWRLGSPLPNGTLR